MQCTGRWSGVGNSRPARESAITPTIGRPSGRMPWGTERPPPRQVEAWLSPGDRDWVLAFYRSTLTGPGSRSCEYRAINRDGQTVWLRDVIRIVRGDDTGVRLYIEDEGTGLEAGLEDQVFSPGVTCPLT